MYIDIILSYGHQAISTTPKEPLPCGHRDPPALPKTVHLQGAMTWCFPPSSRCRDPRPGKWNIQRHHGPMYHHLIGMGQSNTQKIKVSVTFFIARIKYNKAHKGLQNE